MAAPCMHLVRRIVWSFDRCVVDPRVPIIPALWLDTHGELASFRVAGLTCDPLEN